MSPLSDRRRLLAAAAAAALAGLLPSGGMAQARQGFRGIVVDAGPMRRRGFPELADRLTASLTAALNREFAGRITRNPRDPMIVATLDSITFGPTAGGGPRSGVGAGGQETDTLIGSVQAGARQFPLRVVLQAGAGQSWREPNQEMVRADALAASFAHWTRRRLSR